MNADMLNRETEDRPPPPHSLSLSLSLFLGGRGRERPLRPPLDPPPNGTRTIGSSHSCHRKRVQL